MNSVKILLMFLLFLFSCGLNPAYAQVFERGAAVGVTVAASASDQSGMDILAHADGKGILVTGITSVTASPDGQIHCYITSVTKLDESLATITPLFEFGNVGDALTSVVRTGHIDSSTPDTNGPLILARGLTVSSSVFVGPGDFFTCVASIVNREFKASVTFRELR